MTEDPDHDPSLPTRRRRFLAGLGGGAAVGLSGCLGLLETESLTTPPVVEDRPDAVYFPSHVEGMGMVTTTELGDYRLALMYSYPHRFWTVTTTERTRKEPTGDVHLMASLYDDDSGTVVSDTGLSMEVLQDGEFVDQTNVYRMLSQPMGFHYGSNFALDGDGTYEVRVTVGAAGDSLRLTGAFAGDFADSRTAAVPFEYSRSERDDLRFERTEDRAGQQIALDRLSMGEVPTAVAPDAEALPGELLGVRWHADAKLAAAVVEGDAAERLGADDGEAYLLVSPRTPYNQLVLPRMRLSATVERGGETVFDGRLRPTLDDELDYHYGATVPAGAVDRLTVRVETPPQVARHEGYETAFLTRGEVVYDS
jgi:hypothetical protein